MNRNAKKVIVVGAGTAGLITAMILKIRLNLEVTVIYSNKIGIIGVGEGSTEQFNEFMTFAGITQEEIVKETDATFKSGIMFDGWTSDSNYRYMHSVFGELSDKMGQYSHVNAKLITIDGILNFERTYNSMLDSSLLIDEQRYRYPINQYHFNTYKLNDFLIKKSKLFGVNIIEDEINEVNLDENGYVTSVHGEKAEYTGDFFIDSTGFKRILMTKLGAKWNSFSKYLKVNSAITFPTGDEDNYNYWTLAKALKGGWMFRIPVWGRHGNGYIYDKNHISKEDAKKEVEELFGKELEIGKEFSFDPGCLDKIWIKNCCAVGLSGSFLEPLEATSIGTSIQQAFILAHRLASYNEKDAENYNTDMTNILHNMRDYVLLHYLTDRKDTDFWKEATAVELPDTLKSLMEIWKHRLPVRDDVSRVYQSNYCLFWDQNWTQILYGINYFDKKSIKQEFESCAKPIQNSAQDVIQRYKYSEPHIKLISHKDYIRKIREL